jgi:hypothetical protein
MKGNQEQTLACLLPAFNVTLNLGLASGRRQRLPGKNRLIRFMVSSAPLWEQTRTKLQGDPKANQISEKHWGNTILKRQIERLIPM